MNRDPFEDAPVSGALAPDAGDYGERDAEADEVIAQIVEDQSGDDDDEDADEAS